MTDSVSLAIVNEAYQHALAHPDSTKYQTLLVIIVSIIFTLALVGAFTIIRVAYLFIKRYRCTKVPA